MDWELSTRCMSRLLIAGLAICAPAVPTPARAQDSTAVSCDSAFTTYDMRRCLGAELREAEGQMATYLAAARREVAFVALLDSTQAAWLQYRSLECRAASDIWEGGTGQPVVQLQCLVDLTRTRTSEVWHDYLYAGDSGLPDPDDKLAPAHRARPPR